MSTYSDASFACRFALLQLQRSGQSLTGNYLKHTEEESPVSVTTRYESTMEKCSPYNPEAGL